MVNRKKMATVSGVILPMLAFSGQLWANATNEELAARVEQLETLVTRLQQLVVEQGEQQQEMATTVSKKVDAPLSGTKFSYGGYVKFDAMSSSFSDGERATASIGDDILVPSTIPVDGKSGASRFDSSAKTSRFWFKTITPTDMGDVRTHIEMDLLTFDGDERITNANHSRIRHAYLAWDYHDNASLLFGQTWSTFMNVNVLPETVDFIGPTSGGIFNRQAQARWSYRFEKGGAVHVALENPSSGAIDGGGGIESSNFDDNSLPDLALRYDGKAGDLSYSLAAIGRQISYDTGTQDEDAYGLGLSLSGKYQFSNGDDLKVQLNHGHLGRYIALQAFRDAAVEADGDLDLLDVTGGFIAYRHFWSPRWRTTLSYAMTRADNAGDVATTNTEEVSNYGLNLFYSPTDKLSFGMEYIRAKRELENGSDGDLKRLQFTGKYVFE